MAAAGTLRRSVAVAALVAGLGVVGAGLFRGGGGTGLGSRAPDFTLPDLRAPGRQISLAGLRGRPVVVNFWASWCVPCREEAAELASASRANPQVAFLGVNMLDGREEALTFLRRYGIDYPNVRDPGGRVAKRFGVTGVPETVFLDAQGRIVGRHIGALPPNRLSELVGRLRRLGPGEYLRGVGRGRFQRIP